MGAEGAIRGGEFGWAPAATEEAALSPSQQWEVPCLPAGTLADVLAELLPISQP